MKTQIDIKSNNTQISDDNTTTQIQFGFNRWWVIAVVLILILIVIW